LNQRSGRHLRLRLRGATGNYRQGFNNKEHLTIALDAMGGDAGPEVVIPGRLVRRAPP